MGGSILERVATGDAESVEECLARYGGLVWSLARRRTTDASDAEDAVQEIFIDLWRSAARFNPAIASEATFITMVARRRLIDRQRRLGRRPETTALVNDEGAATESNQSSIEIAEEAATARQCLAELRPEERRVLEMSIFDDLPQTQIAEATGLPLGTVKTHARRGLMKLRDLMQSRTQRAVSGGAR